MKRDKKTPTALELGVLAVIWHLPFHDRHGEERIGELVWCDDVLWSPVRRWHSRARGALGSLVARGLIVTTRGPNDCGRHNIEIAVTRKGYNVLKSHSLLDSTEPVSSVIPVHFQRKVA